MKTAVIIDCVVAAVLLATLIYGACRGLFQAVAGLAVIVLSLAGATFAARSLTPAATELVRPVIEQFVTQRMDSALGGSGTENGAESSGQINQENQHDVLIPLKPQISQNTSADSSAASDLTTRIQAAELLNLMGLDDTLRDSLSNRVEEKVRDTGVSIAMAVVESVMESIVYMILFILAFFVLTLLLRLLEKAMNLAMKLPGVHALNALGGAAVGLIEGVLLIFLVIWILRFFHVSFETELIAQTRIFNFFTTHSPLDLLSY